MPFHKFTDPISFELVLEFLCLLWWEPTEMIHSLISKPKVPKSCLNVPKTQNHLNKSKKQLHQTSL